MPTLQRPGVHRFDVASPPADDLPVGVPVFLGFPSLGGGRGSGAAGPPRPVALRSWADYLAVHGAEGQGSHLAASVRGFFENGGEICHVVGLAGPAASPDAALEDGLARIDELEDVDLVAIPDLVRLLQPRMAEAPFDAVVPPSGRDIARLQRRLVAHCDERGQIFALLDPPPNVDAHGLLAGYRDHLRGEGAAVYYPWLKVEDGEGSLRAVPPCGFVAGVIASTDRRTGVFRAPANVALTGVVDLDRPVSEADQDRVRAQGVNVIRDFRGRGIRVWGASTISTNPDWRHINVRRLVTTASRWIERRMAPVVFEPHEPRLWARIVRELTQYFDDLLRAGALRGATAAEAFFVKCDAENNPPEARDAGAVAVEIGLAPTIPQEFIVVRIEVASAGTRLAAAEPGRPRFDGAAEPRGNVR